MNVKLTWQLIVLGALFLWAFLAQGSFSALVIYSQLSGHAGVALPFHRTDLTRTISSVPPPFSIHTGQTLVGTVERRIAGRTTILNLPVQIHQDPVAPLHWVSVIGLLLFLPLSCLLVGFYIAFARPLDPLAWITMTMLVSFGHIAGSGTSWALSSPWRELLLAYHPIFSNT